MKSDGMKRSLQIRFGLVGFFTLAAAVLFLPSTPLGERLPSWWRDSIPKIALGLDLQGGMYLLLSVDVEKGVDNATQRLALAVTDRLKEKNFRFETVDKTGQTTLRVALSEGQAPEPVEKEILDRFGEIKKGGREEGALLFSLDDRYIKTIRDFSASQALEVLRNRIDKFGVAEPLIQRQGDREIVIQLPGLKDPKRALDLIGKTAVLEFKLVDEKASVERALKGEVPEGSEFVYQRTFDKRTGERSEVPFVVKKPILLTGEAVADARVSIDQRYNEPYVSLSFNSVGADRFAQITGDHTKERLAIILDGNVYSAPVIRERIAGGQAQITGRFTMDEAKDLAIILRAGALPAPVSILQNVTVGPTLGADSIQKGVKASIVGALLVVAFMILYYRMSGLIANAALMLNVIMLLGVLAMFNATLTLPGIAGIILTMGMGVDSNVLIFERIKEELRLGKTVRAAIEAGYDRAFTTVIDSHVTTLITAAVLFQFGSGPIKGFAVSLSAGILINLFTALVGTQVVFDFITSRKRLERLSI